MTMPSSLEIAQGATLRLVADIAAEMGLLPEEVALYGRYKAKISLEALVVVPGVNETSVACDG